MAFRGGGGSSASDIFGGGSDASWSPSKGRESVAGIFKRFDVRGDGMFSRALLVQLLRAINKKNRIPEATIRELLRVIDESGSGWIHYETFCDLLFPNIRSTASEASFNMSRGSTAFGAFPSVPNGGFREALPLAPSEAVRKEAVRNATAVGIPPEGGTHGVVSAPVGGVRELLKNQVVVERNGVEHSVAQGQPDAHNSKREADAKPQESEGTPKSDAEAGPAPEGQEEKVTKATEDNALAGSERPVSPNASNHAEKDGTVEGTPVGKPEETGNRAPCSSSHSAEAAPPAADNDGAQETGNRAPCSSSHSAEAAPPAADNDGAQDELHSGEEPGNDTPSAPENSGAQDEKASAANHEAQKATPDAAVDASASLEDSDETETTAVHSTISDPPVDVQDVAPLNAVCEKLANVERGDESRGGNGTGTLSLPIPSSGASSTSVVSPEQPASPVHRSISTRSWPPWGYCASDGAAAIVSCAQDANADFRPYMEDGQKVIDPFSVGTASRWGFFAVYDGHGGRHEVDYVERKLHEVVLAELQALADSVVERENVNGALRSAFEKIDAQLAKEVGAWKSGCTATVALVHRDEVSLTLFVANVGDSRAVVVSDHGARRVTVDHKASDPFEAARVAQEGGIVKHGRVGGSLCVSRSLGDHHLKKKGLSCIPEIHVSSVAGERALVIASDGLWDVVGDEDAGRVVNKCVEEGSKLGGGSQSALIDYLQRNAAQALIDRAKAFGSRDNILALVVFF